VVADRRLLGGSCAFSCSRKRCTRLPASLATDQIGSRFHYEVFSRCSMTVLTEPVATIMPSGAELQDDERVRFVLWASSQATIEIEIDDSKGPPSTDEYAQIGSLKAICTRWASGRCFIEAFGKPPSP
jgi:hypothetical protein